MHWLYNEEDNSVIGNSNRYYTFFYKFRFDSTRKEIWYEEISQYHRDSLGSMSDQSSFVSAAMIAELNSSSNTEIAAWRSAIERCACPVYEATTYSTIYEVSLLPGNHVHKTGNYNRIGSGHVEHTSLVFDEAVYPGNKEALYHRTLGAAVKHLITLKRIELSKQIWEWKRLVCNEES